MGTRGYPTNTLDQATDIVAACTQIDPNFRSGSLTLTSFADDVAQVKNIHAQITALELQLADLRNRRDDRLTKMWDAIKRIRASIKGAYGDDSSEYELVGGTRMSERKRTPRKPQA